MLTQPTEGDKFRTTVRIWAPVYLVIVARALQVLVEAREHLKLGMAQEALVRLPVPPAFCGPRGCGCGGLEGPLWSSQKARGIRDVVARVSADDEAVELLAGHA